jgi:hypothetical protein
MKDIKYTRNGIEKMAQERFKGALIAEGWSVVEDKPQKATEKKKPVKKKAE